MNRWSPTGDFVYSASLAQKLHGPTVVSPTSHHPSMRTGRLHYLPIRTVRFFSQVPQSWFPTIHLKTFSEISTKVVIQSAVRRTMTKA